MRHQKLIYQSNCKNLKAFEKLIIRPFFVAGLTRAVMQKAISATHE